jgi:hypothetical protein
MRSLGKTFEAKGGHRVIVCRIDVLGMEVVRERNSLEVREGESFMPSSRYDPYNTLACRPAYNAHSRVRKSLRDSLTMDIGMGREDRYMKPLRSGFLKDTCESRIAVPISAETKARTKLHTQL